MSGATTRSNQLPNAMRAVMAYAPGDYRIETVPTPRAGPDDIIIEVECCGICAGDSKAYDGAPSFWGEIGRASCRERVSVFV